MADESILTEKDEAQTEGKSVLTDESTVAPEEGVEKTEAESQEKEETKEAEPVEYEFEFPEDVVVDDELVGKFKAVAQGLKLSKEGAQEIINLQIEAQKAQLESWNTTVKQWREAAESDKEVGGKAFKENVAVARQALKEFGTPELREAMDVYGIGNHPEFIRFLYRVGKQMSDDKVVVGGNPKGEAKDLARSLYPSMAN